MGNEFTHIEWLGSNPKIDAIALAEWVYILYGNMGAIVVAPWGEYFRTYRITLNDKLEYK